MFVLRSIAATYPPKVISNFPTAIPKCISFPKKMIIIPINSIHKCTRLPDREIDRQTHRHKIVVPFQFHFLSYFRLSIFCLSLYSLHFCQKNFHRDFSKNSEKQAYSLSPNEKQNSLFQFNQNIKALEEEGDSRACEVATLSARIYLLLLLRLLVHGSKLLDENEPTTDTQIQGFYFSHTIVIRKRETWKNLNCHSTTFFYRSLFFFLFFYCFITIVCVPFVWRVRERKRRW